MSQSSSGSTGGDSSGSGGSSGGTRPQRDPSGHAEGEGRALTFEYEGLRVGYFEGVEAYPTTAGKYRYMPYRAIGHLKMIEECVRQGAARCTYTAKAGTIAFTVRTAGEYGLLEVSEIAPALA